MKTKPYLELESRYCVIVCPCGKRHDLFLDCEAGGFPTGFPTELLLKRKRLQNIFRIIRQSDKIGRKNETKF